MKNNREQDVLFEKLEAESRDLTRLNAEIPDVDPPEFLIDSIMAEIKPKKAPWWRRFIQHLYFPVTITPVKLVPVGFALALFLAVSFYFGFSLGTKKTVSVVAQNTYNAKNTTTILFTLKDPQARKVYVIGSFNHWSPKGYQMRYDEQHGVWKLSLKLPEGQYEYAFLLNGKTIIPDPNALMQRDDGFGNKNSILIVERHDGNKSQS